MERKKKHVSNFLTLSIHDMKTRKKHKSALLLQKYSTKAKTQQYLHNNLIKKRHPNTSVFL